MSLRTVDMELSLIFIIAAVILLVLLVAFVVIGLRRRDAKKISFEPKEVTQGDKSGNYQAANDFNFVPTDKAPAVLPGQELGGPVPGAVDEVTPTPEPVEQEAPELTDCAPMRFAMASRDKLN